MAPHRYQGLAALLDLCWSTWLGRGNLNTHAYACAMHMATGDVNQQPANNEATTPPRCEAPTGMPSGFACNLTVLVARLSLLSSITHYRQYNYLGEVTTQTARPGCTPWRLAGSLWEARAVQLVSLTGSTAGRPQLGPGMRMRQRGWERARRRRRRHPQCATCTSVTCMALHADMWKPHRGWERWGPGAAPHARPRACKNLGGIRLGI